MPHRIAASHAVLLGALRDHRTQIEAEILARIEADDAPTRSADPEYERGLWAAIPAALEHCFAGIERGELNPPPLPTALLSQARVAARSGVQLDVVLRRYFAGYTVLGDFLVAEAEAAGLSQSADLKCLLRSLAASLERLLAAVSEEHEREARGAKPSSRGRRAELIERLLAGEAIEAEELNYDFATHHIGAIAKGPEGEAALRELARALDRRLLLIEREEETVWAWLGGRERIDSEHLRRCLASAWPSSVRLALGEQGSGAGGWRLTHRQARAALPIALHGPQPFVRYADVALLAMALDDDLLPSLLHDLYLRPLEAERDGGAILRETLRAYFATDRNISSTAASLGVKPHTVAARLRTIEERTGQPLNRCASAVQLAIRLEELDVPGRSLPISAT